MKYRIFFSDNHWHVREPNGEVTWHCISWEQAIALAEHLALYRKAELQVTDSVMQNAYHSPHGDKRI